MCASRVVSHALCVASPGVAFTRLIRPGSRHVVDAQLLVDQELTLWASGDLLVFFENKFGFISAQRAPSAALQGLSTHFVGDYVALVTESVGLRTCARSKALCATLLG